MNRSEADYTIAKVTAEVESNRMHWASIVDTIRERISRIHEQIEPIAGYAPVYWHDSLVAEMHDRLNEIEKVKSKYQG